MFSFFLCNNSFYNMLLFHLKDLMRLISQNFAISLSHKINAYQNKLMKGAKRLMCLLKQWAWSLRSLKSTWTTKFSSIKSDSTYPLPKLVSLEYLTLSATTKSMSIKMTLMWLSRRMDPLVRRNTMTLSSNDLI